MLKKLTTMCVCDPLQHCPHSANEKHQLFSDQSHGGHGGLPSLYPHVAELTQVTKDGGLCGCLRCV